MLPYKDPTAAELCSCGQSLPTAPPRWRRRAERTSPPDKLIFTLTCKSKAAACLIPALPAQSLVRRTVEMVGNGAQTGNGFPCFLLSPRRISRQKVYQSTKRLLNRKKESWASFHACLDTALTENILFLALGATENQFPMEHLSYAESQAGPLQPTRSQCKPSRQKLLCSAHLGQS